jgi:hypothetical protein
MPQRIFQQRDTVQRLLKPRAGDILLQNCCDCSGLNTGPQLHEIQSAYAEDASDIFR